MGARSFVAQRPFDQNNVWRIAEVRDEAGGGDAYQKAAAGSEKLLSHQHRIGGPDRAADNSRHAAIRQIELKQLAVVTRPAWTQPTAAIVSQQAHKIAVGIEHADLRDVALGQASLAPPFAQQVFRLKHRGGLAIPKLSQQRRSVALAWHDCFVPNGSDILAERRRRRENAHWTPAAFAEDERVRSTGRPAALHSG